MDEELVNFIVKEVRPHYNIRLENNTKLFLDVLRYEVGEEELKGLGSRMISALEDLAAERQPLQYLFPVINKMEQYARKVLYLIDKDKYNSIHKENGGLSPILTAIGIKKNNIQTAYDLRNVEAHACKEWTRGQYYEKIVVVLIACLKITEKQSERLKKSIYAIKTSKFMAFTKYINSIIKQYKSMISGIVQLDSEEDISQLDLYAIENVTEEKNARRGALHELIKDLPEKRMIIWGDAGAGKTTILEYITYLEAKEYKSDHNNPIPVLIYLGMTTDEHRTLEDYIIEKLGIDAAELKELLKAGKLRLYFDGYNEIPYTERNMLKTKRRREMTSLLVSYPQTFIALTNRPQDGKEFSGIPVFNLLEMDHGKVDEFIQKNSSSDDLTQMVMEAIQQDENLFHLVQKPLILKSLLFIAQMTGQIPKREGLIIGEFLKALFIREQQEKYDEFLDEQKINLLLRRVGFETSENNRTNSGISQETILDIMSRCEKDYNFSYDNFYALKLIVELGIMKKRDNQYVFAHQSFQDYYAAQEEKAILNI